MSENKCVDCGIELSKFIDIASGRCGPHRHERNIQMQAEDIQNGPLERKLKNYYNRARRGLAPMRLFKQLDKPRVKQYKRLISHQGDNKFKIGTFECKQKLSYPLGLEPALEVVRLSHDM